MKTQHTPGPWRIWRDMDPKQPLEIAGPSEDNICEMRMFNTNAQANAQLISAAPELLEALQAARERLNAANAERDAKQGHFKTSDIESAIGKATT